MELYKYDNYFSFNLSDNYKILKSKNFANNELINVHSGKYFTEQEEEKYKYAYTLKTLNLEFAEPYVLG